MPDDDVALWPYVSSNVLPERRQFWRDVVTALIMGGEMHSAEILAASADQMLAEYDKRFM